MQIESRPTTLCLILVALCALAGCSTLSRQHGSSQTTSGSRSAGGGGYYLDDGPGANPPANLEAGGAAPAPPAHDPARTLSQSRARDLVWAALSRKTDILR
jgi:hypothetical protein